MNEVWIFALMFIPGGYREARKLPVRSGIMANIQSVLLIFSWFCGERDE